MAEALGPPGGTGTVFGRSWGAAGGPRVKKASTEATGKSFPEGGALSRVPVELRCPVSG